MTRKRIGLAVSGLMFICAAARAAQSPLDGDLETQSAQAGMTFERLAPRAGAPEAALAQAASAATAADIEGIKKALAAKTTADLKMELGFLIRLEVRENRLFGGAHWFIRDDYKERMSRISEILTYGGVDDSLVKDTFESLRLRLVDVECTYCKKRLSDEDYRRNRDFARLQVLALGKVGRESPSPGARSIAVGDLGGNLLHSSIVSRIDELGETAVGELKSIYERNADPALRSQVIGAVADLASQCSDSGPTRAAFDFLAAQAPALVADAGFHRKQRGCPNE